MLLPGNLHETSLGDLFGQLYRARVSGVLELLGQDAPFVGASHRVSLSNGLVSHVNTPLPSTKIGEVLYRRQALTTQRYRLFLTAIQRHPDIRAGDLLMDTAQVPPELLMDGLTWQVQERLKMLSLLQQATVRFHPSSVRSRERVEPKVLAPEQFLHGAPRARERLGNQGHFHRTWTRHTHEASSDPWSALGLQHGASRQQIRRAFRRLALRLHPDLNQDVRGSVREALVREFSRVTLAYQTLVSQQYA